MREVTSDMIHTFKLNKLKYDMMGYRFVSSKELSFHHLVVPKRNCKGLGLGDGYYFWNGAILKQLTSHDYLHLIERKDHDMFMDITTTLMKENDARKVEIEYLKRIREILLAFEREHDRDRSQKGGLLIKPSYITERVPVLEREKRLVNVRKR